MPASYLAPNRLKPGGRVAIVAPASPVRSDELNAGLDIIRECGLEPVLGPNVKGLKSVDIHAAPLMDRVDELMWAFTDPSIDGVITALGGCGSAELLPYLDFGAIRDSGKLLLGLSDITALNNGILAGAGLTSVNGQYPSIRIDEGERFREADSQSMKFTFEMLMSDQPWLDRPLELNEYFPRTVCPGRASGCVVGGNLDTFCTLLGTPFCPDLEGAIFFVEDVHKNGEAIARLLIHCRLAGVFDKVAGIVVGEFAYVPEKTDPKDPSIDDVIAQYLSSGPPCMYGVSFSHGAYTCPIPIGAQCTMDADTGELSFGFRMADPLTYLSQPTVGPVNTLRFVR